MRTYFESGYIIDNIRITFIYQIDDNGVVTSKSLTKEQLEAFTPYALETQKHEPKHGSQLREFTPEENHLWVKFVETILVCGKCPGKDNLKFNPYLGVFLCPEHQLGTED